jgi:hypothetical protein
MGATTCGVEEKCTQHFDREISREEATSENYVHMGGQYQN